ncbi:hypothetical protein IMSAG049_00539 [Clostridiales bacterium]|nr:hypothetical protein IMSAG049_00539 [Clostridiales bacterium]
MSETDEPTEDIGANTLPLYESVQSPSDIHPNTSETTEPAIDIQSDVLPPSEATQPISDFSSDALPQPETANPELDIFDTLPEKEHIDEAAINSADVVNPGSLPISEFAEPSTIKYIDESGNKLYYTNVYETIVKACIYEYLQKFQVCTCSHCLADATALALTNLPSKYVVTDSPDVGSVINYIEQNEMASIMTEVTKACFEIDAKPRH